MCANLLWLWPMISKKPSTISNKKFLTAVELLHPQSRLNIIRDWVKLLNFTRMLYSWVKYKLVKNRRFAIKLIIFLLPLQICVWICTILQKVYLVVFPGVDDILVPFPATYSNGELYRDTPKHILLYFRDSGWSNKLFICNFDRIFITATFSTSFDRRFGWVDGPLDFFSFVGMVMR